MQLRRYELPEGTLEQFVDWWRDVMVPTRSAHGYAVEFAYAVPSTSELVWMVSIDGDEAALAALDAQWQASPERLRAIATAPAMPVQHVGTATEALASL